jgi:hypothetical protein
MKYFMKLLILYLIFLLHTVIFAFVKAQSTNIAEISKINIHQLSPYHINDVFKFKDSIYLHDNRLYIYSCHTPNKAPIEIKLYSVNFDKNSPVGLKRLAYNNTHFVNGNLLMMSGYATVFYSRAGRFLFQSYFSGAGFRSQDTNQSYMDTYFGPSITIPHQPMQNKLLVSILPTSPKAMMYYQLPRNDQTEFGELQAKLSDTAYWTTPYPVLATFQIPSTFHPCDTVTNDTGCWDAAGWHSQGFVGAIHPRVADYYYQGKMIARYLDPHRRVEPFTVDPELHLIFSGDALSPSIQVYDTNNRVLRSFGIRGKHIKESDTIVYFQRSWLEAEAQAHGRGTLRSHKLDNHLTKFKTKAKYQSYVYDLMYMDTIRNHLYRLYEIPLAINIDSLYEVKGDNADSFEFPRKPTFLQIYDLSDNDRLIFDGPVPAPFKVLDVDMEGYLWAIAGQEEEKLVIRKYRMVRE